MNESVNIVLGAVPGNDLREGPVALAGGQETFAEDLGLHCLAGGGVDMPGQTHRGGVEPVRWVVSTLATQRGV